MEIAELPERTIHVEQSEVAIKDLDVENNRFDTRASEDELTTEENRSSKSVDSAAVSSVWQWISLGLFILWLLTMVLWWRSKKAASTVTKTDADKNKLSSDKAIRQLRQASLRNDPVLAKEALLVWAKVHWPEKNIVSLDAIKEYSSLEMKNILDDLNSRLYGRLNTEWNGTAFFDCFKSQSFENKKSNKAQGKLEPLYKT